MKILIGLMMLFSFNTYATEFYTIRAFSGTMGQLKLECEKNMREAEVKLAEIADRLSPGEPNPFIVDAYFGRNSSKAGYCVLDFKTADSRYSLEEEVPVFFKRLSRDNWEAACEPAYKAASANPNSPFTILWGGWTVIQGRFCFVSTLLVTKQ